MNRCVQKDISYKVGERYDMTILMWRYFGGLER